MPHHYQTNVDQVAADMRHTIDSFGFTSTHEGRALGELLVDEIVEGIHLRSVEKQCDGDGTPWPENKWRTRQRKIKLHGEALVNVDTGQMLSVRSLRGKVTITQYLVTIEYGTGTAAQSPDRLPATQRIHVAGGTAKELITDVDKATFAAEQNRRFFELDDEICAKTFTVFTTALGAFLANPGR